MMNEQMNYQIYISYTQKGTDAYARVFYEKLTEQGYSTFLDFVSVYSNDTLENRLSIIEQCDDFILLLSENDLQQCKNENDSFYLEISQAIKSGKNIIPVFINGYRLPRKSELPEYISKLSDKRGFECTMEDFDVMFESMNQCLKSNPLNKNNFNYQIFISYRRNGSDAHARVFYEKLKEIGYSVFLDFESLFSGGFENNILSAIEQCEDFVLLLPKDGLKRCVNEEDVLRKEIRQAIKSGKNIIPIFINGFTMPDKEKLPEDIAELADEHGFECSMEYFDAVFEKLLRNLNSIPLDDYLFKSLSSVRKHTLSVHHAYFKKWAHIKLEEFLSENNEFFEGTNHTNPHAEDTFGISGIEFTKKSIKAITSVSDYWEDNFTLEYLNKQAQMINRGIEVHRVFVIEQGQIDKAIPQMDYQYNLGINVYYIEKDNEYIDPEWLSEDYLIQDDELLVEISCESHRFDSQNNITETVTMDKAKVKKKIERIQRIFERSLKYCPEDFATNSK